MDIKTIAKMAGVSTATVSRVLNGKSVTDATKSRVMQVIDSVGYVPNYIGRHLRMQQSKKLLVLLPTIQNSFYAPIVNSFETYARAEGFSTLFAVTNRKAEVERQYIDMLYTREVDGLASFMPTIKNDELRSLAANYPYVAICWRGGSDVDANYVCIDNTQAAYDMTQYLISLGHKRIAVMNGNFKERIYERERDKGYRRAMSDANLPTPNEYCRICNYSYTDGYRECEALMNLPEPPTAIFTMSDERAVGVMRYLREHGLQAGRDVDVAGFDNTRDSVMLSPEITTVEQPREEIGMEASRLLIELVRDNNQTRRGIILRHRLILRESTRKPTDPPPAP